MTPPELKVVRHAHPSAFLARAGRWLLRREAEHNLILGLADRLALGDTGGFEPPFYWATVEEDGEVVGCAFRTPPHPFGLTRMPAAAVELLVEEVAAVYGELPGVIGPEEAAAAFAEAWSGRTGVGARRAMGQTIYALDSLTPPAPWPPGRLRRVRPGDLEVAVRWMEAFQGEAHAPPGGDIRPRVEGLIVAGDLYFWEDEAPRTTAAVVARTPHGARMGFVYTPPEHRGRGYGTAVSAAVTERILADGARFSFLYADRANSTSNAIYRRLGYEPVCDVADYRFGGEASP